MPNWVKNRLTVGGKNCEAVIDEITKKDENGEREIDFNKIIPMPESLKIIAGSTTKKCVALYLTAVNPNVEYYGNESDKIPLAEYSELLGKLKANGKKIEILDIMLPVKTIAEYEKFVIGGDPNFCAGTTREAAHLYGKRAIDNVLQYGSMDWYDWSLANWGTKWNACECIFDGDTIEFDTAWSDVSELMRLLSEKYPNNTFYYEFAEEQVGLYAGEFTFENGDEIDGGYLKERSKEAYEKYFELWGGKEDYRYDKRTKTYKYIDNETKNNDAEM